MFSLRGRTIFDIASHPDQAPGAPERNKIAEHDYTATVKVSEQVSVSGNFAERNFFAYFAGTNLPSLFRQDDKDMFKGWGEASRGTRRRRSSWWGTTGTCTGRRSGM